MTELTVKTKPFSSPSSCLKYANCLGWIHWKVFLILQGQSSLCKAWMGKVLFTTRTEMPQRVHLQGSQGYKEPISSLTLSPLPYSASIFTRDTLRPSSHWPFIVITTLRLSMVSSGAQMLSDWRGKGKNFHRKSRERQREKQKSKESKA